MYCLHIGLQNQGTQILVKEMQGQCPISWISHHAKNWTILFHPHGQNLSLTRTNSRSRQQLFWFPACLKAEETGNLTAELNPSLFVSIYALISASKQWTGIQTFRLIQGLLVWLSCSIHVHSGARNCYLYHRHITRPRLLQVLGEGKEQN